MKIITARLKAVEKLEVIPLSDLHIGDPHADMKLIQQRIDYIKEHSEVKCLLAGDLIDNATKTSIGDVYHNSHNPNDQITTVVNLLTPIKKQILLCVPGNHEARTWRTDGVDVTEQICQRLGIMDKYAPETALLDLFVGKYNYKVYVTHGSGGGRKIGAKALRLLELADIIDADVYIQGHTHTPMITRKCRMVQTKNGIEPKELLFVNLAASLSYGGYGEVQGFSPSSCISPMLYFSGAKQLAWSEL